MTWFTFAVLVFGGYVIYRWALKAWKKSDVESRIDNTLFTEEQHEKVEKFKEDHENPRNKIKDINKFVNNKHK